MSYPINLEVAERECVVLGGGVVAHRKVLGLLDAGAHVIVIAPTLCNELRTLIQNVVPPSTQPSETNAHDVERAVSPSFAHRTSIVWIERRYTVGCLPRGILFIAATDDPNINRLAALEAAQKNMIVNIVNDPTPIHDAVRFENPSTIRRGKFLLTISTGGTSPALSKIMRLELEKIIDGDFERRLEIAAEFRDIVKRTIDDPNQRAEFWRTVMSDKNFSEVNIRNALNSYRTQSQDRSD